MGEDPPADIWGGPQTQGDKCNEGCTSDQRLTRTPLVALSVSKGSCFPRAPSGPACIPRVSFFCFLAFREFQLFAKRADARKKEEEEG